MLDGLRAMANPITFDQALSIFTKMIDIQPDFAEVCFAYMYPLPRADSLYVNG